MHYLPHKFKITQNTPLPCSVATNIYGLDIINTSMHQQLAEYTVEYKVLNDRDLQDLRQFFDEHSTAQPFRLRDKNNHLIKSTLINKPCGKQTKFKIQTAARRIYHPVPSTVEILNLPENTSYKVDDDIGYIIFDAPLPADFEIVLSCQFDTAVRFCEPRLDFTEINKGLFKISPIKIKECALCD